MIENQYPPHNQFTYYQSGKLQLLKPNVEIQDTQDVRGKENDYSVQAPSVPWLRELMNTFEQYVKDNVVIQTLDGEIPA